MNRLNILSVALSLCVLPVVAAEKSPACLMRPEIILSRAEYTPEQPVQARFVLTNDGSGTCTLPGDLLPEGWLIQIFIKDARGNLVYGSKSAKIEMTSATMQGRTILQTKQSHAVALQFPGFGPGNYVVEGRFSTLQLAAWKIEGLPIGVWDAPAASFRVSAGK